MESMEIEKAPDQPLLEKKEGKDLLSRQQINQALMEIEDLVPLRQLAKREHIMPVCGWCGKKSKPDFKHQLRAAILKDLNIKMPVSEESMQKEPFLIFGYGINAYFDIMISLSYMCIIITLMLLPLYYGYALNNTKGLKAEKMYALGQFTLGNLGGSSNFCGQRRLGGKTLTVTCPSGQIEFDSAYDSVINYGLISKAANQKIYCTEKGIWDQESNSIEKCTNWFNHAEFKKRLSNSCNKKGECKVNTENLIQKFEGKTAPAECSSEDAFVYVQLPCLIPAERTSARLVYGLMGSCLSVFVYLFTLVYFDYASTVEKTKYVEWDVKTITAGDYTVEFDINRSTWEHWQNTYYDETNILPECAQFKLYIQDELQEICSALPNQGYEVDETDVKIAQITMAYDNALIINRLTQRGTLIKAEKWDKLNEKNQQILNDIQNQEHLDKFQTPVSVFATFESEEGYHRALMYNELQARAICGQQFEIQEASEPTDIIWENRHFTPEQRTHKRIVVYFVIVVLLMVSAGVIFFCTNWSLSLKKKYPKLDCAKSVYLEYDYSTSYETRSYSAIEQIQKATNLKRWQEDAIKEHYINEQYEKNGKKTHFQGAMQCFCTMQKAEGNPKTKEYVSNDIWQDKAKGIKYKAPFCKQYADDKLKSLILGQSVAFIIIAVNLILKNVIIHGITWVGEDTNSEQLTSITNGVFAAQFFNTGILILLVNGNMTEHSPHFFTKFVAGPFYDYTPDWYSTVGFTVVKTMIINSILPYVTLTAGFIVPALKRKLDNKFTNSFYNTKKTSLAAYRDLYSGQIYFIHFKYSNILNIVYITMMYGVGMPILFPIAAFNFLNQYICERYILAYECKQPPSLDDKLTKNAFNKLQFAPMLMLFNGYWMLSNKQIFFNIVNPIDNTLQSMKSGHFPSVHVRNSSPLLLVSVAAIFLMLIQKLFQDQLQKWGFSMQEKDIEVDEDLPPFFTTVKLSQSDELLSEEYNMRKNYGFSYNDGDTIQALEDSKNPKKPIQGTPWYSLLSNPKYSGLFSYCGAFVGERHKIIEDDSVPQTNADGEAIWSEREIQTREEQSDMIMILLNLSYIPDDVVKGLENFEEGWRTKFKARMDNYNQSKFSHWLNKLEELKSQHDHKTAYKMHNDQLEESYGEFVKKAKEGDGQYHLNKEEADQRAEKLREEAQ